MEASAPGFGLAIWLRQRWIFPCQLQAGTRAAARLCKTFLHSPFALRNSTLAPSHRPRTAGGGARWELTALRQIAGTCTGKSGLPVGKRSRPTRCENQKSYDVTSGKITMADRPGRPPFTGVPRRARTQGNRTAAARSTRRTSRPANRQSPSCPASATPPPTPAR